MWRCMPQGDQRVGSTQNIGIAISKTVVETASSASTGQLRPPHHRCHQPQQRISIPRLHVTPRPSEAASSSTAVDTRIYARAISTRREAAVGSVPTKKYRANQNNENQSPRASIDKEYEQRQQHAESMPARAPSTAPPATSI
jgi:hypothetical protein